MNISEIKAKCEKMSKALMMNELMTEMADMETRMKRINELIRVLSVGVGDDGDNLPMEVEKESYEMKSKSQEAEEKEKEIEENIECSCCFETYNIKRFIECNNRHLMCINCVNTYAESQLFSSFNCDIRCINSKEKCNALYSVDMLSKILSKNSSNKYNELKTEKEYKMINECNDDINIRKCSHCESGVDIGHYIKEIDIMTCLTCAQQTCLLCDEKAHPTQKCNQLSKPQSIDDKLSEAVILTCNKCNVSIVKEHGCNKMECVCGNKMCNICKKDINDVGYRHFCNNHNCNRQCNKCHTFDHIVENPVMNVPNIVDGDLAREPRGLKIYMRNPSGRVVTRTF